MLLTAGISLIGITIMAIGEFSLHLGAASLLVLLGLLSLYGGIHFWRLSTRTDAERRRDVVGTVTDESRAARRMMLRELMRGDLSIHRFLDICVQSSTVFEVDGKDWYSKASPPFRVGYLSNWRRVYVVADVEDVPLEDLGVRIGYRKVTISIPWTPSAVQGTKLATATVELPFSVKPSMASAELYGDGLLIEVPRTRGRRVRYATGTFRPTVHYQEVRTGRPGPRSPG